jgi:hypothetical protein
MRQRPSSDGRRFPFAVLICSVMSIAAVAVVLAGGRNLAERSPQVNIAIPADPELDRIQSAIAESAGNLGMGALGGPLFTVFEAQRIMAQSILWEYRLQVEDALMTAWTTQTMAELDQQVRGAVAGGARLVAKLQADADSGIIDAATRNVVQAALNKIENELKLTVKGNKAVATFDDVRRRVIKGYVRPILVRDSSRLGVDLLDYQRALEQAEKIALGLSTGPNPSSPMRQLRIEIQNDSAVDSAPNAPTPMVFFVRVLERGDGGAYTPRRDTERWIVVFPREAGAKLTGEDPGQELIRKSLASNVWLTIKPQDQIEVRVATYGPTRERIRWTKLRGAQVRPEVTSLRRGFYWWAYEVEQSPTSRLVSRWYPMQESYAWQFTSGMWKDDPVTPVTTSPGELRETYTQGFTITGDRFKWTLPASLDRIKAQPDLVATVTGQAAMFMRNARGETPQPVEKGTATLRLKMRVW